MNRIDEFWVRVDDRRIVAGGLWLSLCDSTAAKLTRVFNRIAGGKIISLRLIGVSESLSFASLFLSLASLFGVLSYLLLAHADMFKQKVPALTDLKAVIGVFLFFPWRAWHSR